MPAPAAIALGAKWLPRIFKGASLLGGLFGKKKKKIDPNWLAQNMGPAAHARRTQEIANQLLNSAYGRELMENAASQGHQFAAGVADRAAAAGLTPDQGGQSATSDFTMGAAEGAGNKFKRDVQTDIYGQAAPVAQDQLNTEYQAYLANLNLENSQPNMWERVGNAAGQVASMYPPSPQAPGQADPNKAAPAAPAAPAAAMPAGPMVGTAQFQMPQVPSLAMQNPYVARMLSMQNPAQRMVRSRRRGGLQLLGGQ